MTEAEGSTLAPGTRVGGRFVLERLLRREILSEVYLARAEGGGTARFELRRILAATPAPGVEQQVRRELDRVAAVKSRAVPAVVAVAVDPAGLLIVTDAPEALVPRDTLRDLLARGEKLPPKDAVRVLREVARALDALHGLVPPVVHRALTPENVSLMDRRQSVWLTESGLTHALVASGVIAARAPVAPTEYRSPDEILQRVTPRGDIFALASLAFELLTLTPAFRGASEAATESAILRGPRPSVAASWPATAPAIDAALHRAWSADAEGGFARASELMAVLDRALDGGGETPGTFTSRTMIGLGGPAARTPGVVARISAPRAPVAPESPAEGAKASPRILPPTQKVQVPRVHPPGTEPLSAEPPREDRTSQPEPAPPRAVAPKAAPVEATPSRDRIARAVSEVGTDFNDITKPVRIDPPPEAKGDIAPESPERSSDAPPRDSWQAVLRDDLPEEDVKTAVRPSQDESELPTQPPPTVASPQTFAPAPTTFGSSSVAPTSSVPPRVEGAGVDADVFSSDDLGLEDVEPAPAPKVSRPPPPPATARSHSVPPRSAETDVPPLTSVPALAPSAAEAEVSVAASAPSTPPVVEAPPSPAPVVDADFDLAPLVPLVDDDAPFRVDDTPVPPPPIPPMLPPVEAPPPAFVAPAPEVLRAPALAPRPFVAPPPPEPEPPPRRWRLGAAAGLLAAAAIAGGLWLTRASVPPVAPPPERPVPVHLPPTPPPAPAADASVGRVDVPAATDVAPTPVDAVADVAARGDAPASTADVLAAAVALPDAGRPGDAVAVVAPDAGSVAPSVEGIAPPVMRGDALRSHPRGRETVRLEDDMFDEVIACIARRHRRRVRVSASYLGATGLADQVRISPPYDEPESGRCIERVVRRHPVGRFTDERWETGFVFDPEDE